MNFFYYCCSTHLFSSISIFTLLNILIWFQVNFESSKEYPSQKDRPKCLSFQVTRATITNIRALEQSSRADLAKCVDSFHMGSLFFGSEFPSQPTDFSVVTQKFLDHISATDNIRNVPMQLDISTLEVLVSNIESCVYSTLT